MSVCVRPRAAARRFESRFAPARTRSFAMECRLRFRDQRLVDRNGDRRAAGAGPAARRRVGRRFGRGDLRSAGARSAPRPQVGDLARAGFARCVRQGGGRHFCRCRGLLPARVVAGYGALFDGRRARDAAGRTGGGNSRFGPAANCVGRAVGLLVRRAFPAAGAPPELRATLAPASQHAGYSPSVHRQAARGGTAGAGFWGRVGYVWVDGAEAARQSHRSHRQLRSGAGGVRGAVGVLRRRRLRCGLAAA